METTTRDVFAYDFRNRDFCGLDEFEKTADCTDETHWRETLRTRHTCGL